MMRGTALIRINRALARARQRAQSDDRGVAMLTAILFMIIMAGISTVILGVVTVQTTPTFLDQKETKTIYSAQAGIQSALSMIRSATTVNVNGSTYGDPTKLPCNFTGTPNNTTDGNGYSVTIQYFLVDPTGMTTTQQNAAAMSCTQATTATQYSSGSYGVSGGTPLYALITSQGTASQIARVSTLANRTITALYTFSVSNVNVQGGLIYVGGDSLCIEAVSAAVGSLVKLVSASSCSITSTNSSLLLWTYSPSWQLELSSTTANGATGLCITGPAQNGQSTQNVTLQTCLGSTNVNRWNQLWSWTGSYTWEGELTPITGPSNYWISPGADTAGSYLQVSVGTNGTMDPKAQVGAGAASYKTHQMVNYLEFGRCADVTNEVITSTAMISYPCKQDPTGGTSYITWNQKWYYCEPGDISASCAGITPSNGEQIWVNYLDQTPAVKYCLTTPATGQGFFPTFQPCASSGPLVVQQTWKRFYDTGTYDTSYIFEDYLNRCLQADSSQQYSSGISELDVAGCNGHDEQKWNAPPTYASADLGGYRELSGG